MGEPTLETLVAEVEGAGCYVVPLDCLSGAVEKAERLRCLSDELLGHFVERARRNGHSWTEIGAALEVSKQAAQQRFAPRHPAAPGWPERFAQPARRAIALGEQEAHALGHNYLGTEHVLLGLALEPDGLAHVALERAGVTAEAVREQLEEWLGACSDAPSGTARRVAPRLKRALDRAAVEAQHLGHRCPDGEHLLLALSGDGEAMSAQVLTALGVTDAQLRERIADLLGVAAVELARPLDRPPRRSLRRRSRFSPAR